MSENIDLHKIELTGELYEAQFLKTDPGDLPPGCILPDELNSIPTLPPPEVELPKECTFIVEPPIPEPYICEPTFEGGFGISICDEAAKSGVSITGSVSLGLDPNSECSYVLGGDFQFCMPCIPTIEGEVSVGVCNSNKNKTSINEITPIKIKYNEEDCLYTLEGQLEVCTEVCEPSGSGAINFSTCQIEGKNSVRVDVTEAVALNYNPDTCVFDLTGAVEICAPCTPSVSGAVNFFGTGAADVFGGPLSFQYNTDSCDYNLSGDVTVHVCETTLTVSDPTVTFEELKDAYGHMYVTKVGDCGFQISSDLNIIGYKVPCKETKVIASDDTSDNTIQFSVTVNGTKSNVVEVAYTVSVEDCAAESPCTGLDDPADGCCCFKVKVTPQTSEVALAVTLPTTQINLCDPDSGAETSITVLTASSSGGGDGGGDGA